MFHAGQPGSAHCEPESSLASAIVLIENDFVGDAATSPQQLSVSLCEFQDQKSLKHALENAQNAKTAYVCLHDPQKWHRKILQSIFVYLADHKVTLKELHLSNWGGVSNVWQKASGISALVNGFKKFLADFDIEKSVAAGLTKLVSALTSEKLPGDLVNEETQYTADGNLLTCYFRLHGTNISRSHLEALNKLLCEHRLFAFIVNVKNDTQVEVLVSTPQNETLEQTTQKLFAILKPNYPETATSDVAARKAG